MAPPANGSTSCSAAGGGGGGGGGGSGKGDFGRDEFNALLGGGLSERLTRPVLPATAAMGVAATASSRTANRSSATTNDVSDLTVAETAALLLQEQKRKKEQGIKLMAAAATGKRLRAGGGATTTIAAASSSQPQPKRKYQALLEEEMKKQGQLVENMGHDKTSSTTGSTVPSEQAKLPAHSNEPPHQAVPENDETDFKTAKRSRHRAKAAPVVVLQKQQQKDEIATATSLTAARRRNDNSSDDDSSSSSSGSQPPPKRPQRSHRARASDSDTDSSDSDDSALEQRRARLVQQRQKRLKGAQEGATAAVANAAKERIATKAKEAESNEIDATNSTDAAETVNPSKDAQSNGHTSGETKGARRQSSNEPNDSDSDEECGSSSESSSDSDDEQDDDAVPQPIRPVFVPKHKRGLAATLEAELEQHERHTQLQMEQDARRKQESRAMVQQIVSSSSRGDHADSTSLLVGLLMATALGETIPNDVDEENDTRARDEWQVRELERLLDDWDLEQELVQEERERARRRKMTDEERMREDAQLRLRLNDHGRPSDSSQESRQGQRFFHRGAFYMDESEWDESDVRQRGTEYAQAVTGEDKRDRRQLPKVMQVKKFGFANQSKYKGLAAEDTTDKSMEMLPLKRRK